jgi:hypothetical protein
MKEKGHLIIHTWGAIGIHLFQTCYVYVRWWLYLLLGELAIEEPVPLFLLFSMSLVVAVY